jgi:hypothetical protein
MDTLVFAAIVVGFIVIAVTRRTQGEQARGCGDA